MRYVKGLRLDLVQYSFWKPQRLSLQPYVLCLKNFATLIVNNFYKHEPILIISGKLYATRPIASKRM